DVSDVREFNRGGSIESGLYAAFAQGVFQQNWPTYFYAGEETLRDRRAVRYNYQVPLLGSGYRISAGGQLVTVPFSGSFWAHGETLEVMRLTIPPNEVPVGLGIRSILQTIDYAKVRLSGAEYLLPQQAETITMAISGAKTL